MQKPPARTVLIVLSVVLGVLSLSAQEASSSKTAPSKRTADTTVNVYGKQSKVATDERAKPSFLKRTAQLPGKAWNGMVNLFGWSMGTGDDIPSPREAREKTGERERKNQ